MSTQFTLQSAVGFPVTIWMNAPSASYQGCALDTFKLFLYTEDSTPHHISLYSQGSNSIPWQTPQNKWSHLNPEWRFTDLSGNAIDSIIPSNTVTTVFSGTTGYMASAEFYYIDDLPTAASGVLLRATVDYRQYPVQEDAAQNTQSVPGYVNSQVMTTVSYVVSALTPTSLQITRDGVNPMSNFYWIDSPIPFIVSVVGSSLNPVCSAVMKNVPSTNLLGLSAGPILRNINGISNSALTWTPDNNSSYLSAFDNQGFCIGGYLMNDVISTQAASSIRISASGTVIYGSSSLNLSGISNTFNIYDFAGYDIRRYNESWDAVNQIHMFARTPQIVDNPILWNQYMASVWGDANSPQGTGFGREAYEKIANFVSNTVDVDTCNIKQLYSLAQCVDVTIDDYGFNLPPELRRIMDICSVNQQQLWGARCGCHRNIANSYTTYVSAQQTFVADISCEYCGHAHPGNRGSLFDASTYMVTAFVPFITEDRVSNEYQLVIPPLSGSTSVYPLSSYYNIVLPPGYNYETPTPTILQLSGILIVTGAGNTSLNGTYLWNGTYYSQVSGTGSCRSTLPAYPGWYITPTLALYYNTGFGDPPTGPYSVFPTASAFAPAPTVTYPSSTINMSNYTDAISYFNFYNYVVSSCEQQIAGVINWDDPNTTLDETISSVDNWYGSGQTLERIINYTLYKGLGLIEE